MTIYCYFAVFIPFHYEWLDGTGPSENLGYLLTMAWSLYLVWGIIANYYFAVQTPPGTVLDGVSSDNVSINHPVSNTANKNDERENAVRLTRSFFST